MKKILAALIVTAFMGMALSASAWEPNPNDKMELNVQKSILDAKQTDPSMSTWFDTAAGYAVFPKVGKAGIGVGGARGKGLVIQGDQVIADATLTQLTVGLQLGGQVYQEYIFFKDQTALDDFLRGNFELGAQVSAVAVTAGASADTSYNSGVAVFTIAEGGLMYEASVGGQKFNVKKRQ